MNTKKTIATLIVSAAVILPFAASAISIDDLQAQVRSLLGRIAQLQTSVVASVPGTSGSGDVISVTAVPRICMLDFAGSLRLGSRGDGVRGLQEFLKNEGALSAEATGYFGAQTQAALQKWQASQGVVSQGSAQTTGWGVLGPATRARINARCGTANVITVSPSSGPAPLTVTVVSQVGDSGTIRPSAYDAQDTLIDFGDGSERQWVNCEGKQNNQYGTLCATPQKFAHTYSKDATYTITLLKAGGMCIGGCPERTIGTAYVTVGADKQSGSLDAAPQAGQAPLSVDFTYHPSSDGSGTYWIDYGDGNGQEMRVQEIQCIRAPCISPSVASHTYATSGTYTATVTAYIGCMHSNPRCMIATMPLASVVIRVTGTSSNRPPTISSFSGPTSLSINESGTWTILASDPESGPLTYYAWWGDENVYAPNAGAGSSARDVVQTTTFTHAYANPGTYTVSMTVRDATGAEAKTSSTVVVGRNTTACTQEYAPVCGRPQGCANTCAPGMYCTMICRLNDPVTYGNRCALNAAGAEYISEGVCPAQANTQ